MIEIHLPRLAGTRDDADRLLAELDVPNRAAEGETVALLARDVMATSSSFADQLVKRLLEDRSDLKVVLVAPPKHLWKDMSASRSRRKVDGKRLRNGRTATVKA